MGKARRVGFALIYAGIFASISFILIDAQYDQSGFINIDCGSTSAYSNFKQNEPILGFPGSFQQTMPLPTLSQLDWLEHLDILTLSRFHNRQWLSEKSDVYSFGVVLLEIITSKPVNAKTPEKNHISGRVSHMISNTGNIKSIIEPRLEGQYDVSSDWKTVEVAISPTSNRRPTMTEVVIQLSQCLTMEKARKIEKYTIETMDSIE